MKERQTDRQINQNNKKQKDKMMTKAKKRQEE